MAKANFERTTVIDAATQLFWQSGYANASMQDVFRATGLKPGSLYLAFGNKSALYKESMQRYAELSIEKIKTSIEQAQTPMLGICELILSMIREANSCHYCSCFLVKSQLELSASDQELFEFSQQQLLNIESTFKGYLLKEYSQSDANIHAASLMLTIFGIRVYGYLNQAQSNMINASMQNLSWLPWEQSCAMNGLDA